MQMTGMYWMCILGGALYLAVIVAVVWCIVKIRALERRVH
jgi:hypothetical protein